MNKNVKDSLKDLKKALLSVISSRKIKAAILAPLALSLVACSNVGDSGNPPPPRASAL